MQLLKQQFYFELTESKLAFRRGDFREAWRRLERAHVLGQTHPYRHLRCHFEMLKVAWSQRDIKELEVQMFFVLISAPASVLKLFPVGNKGRAKHIKLGAMPIDEDLKQFMSQ